MGTRRTLVNLVALIAFAAVCVGAMEVLAFNIGQPRPLAHNFTLSAYFDDADGIPTNADVRVAGLQVGKVTGIGHDAQHPGKTRLDMDITDSAAEPHSNAFAKVRPKTLLGEKYVDLNPGTADHELIPNGGTLLATATSVENDVIFNAFDKQTREDERNVLQELDVAVTSRDGDVQAILPQLDKVLGNLAPVAQVYSTDQPLVDSILTNLRTVMATLADEHTQLAGFLGNGNQALGAIASRDASLVTTLQQISQFDQRLNRVLTATVSAQQQSIDKLQPTLDSTHAWISAIIYPRAECGNRKCGFDEVLTGTLQGKLQYPDDQLSVTTPEGNRVTNEWASMFSSPADSIRSGNPTNRSALNIVLSEDCETVQRTATSIIDFGSAVNSQLKQACNTLTGHGSLNTSTAATATGPAPGGTTAATLLQSLEAEWS